MYLAIEDKQVKVELIDVEKEHIDNNMYYFYCRCPNPMNICWRFKPIKPGYYTGICKQCNTEIGVYVKGKD